MTTNSKFDRRHEYDSLGRVTELRTGAEARSTSASTLDRPYREDVSYDAFNNLTNRAGKYWWVGLRDGATTFTYGNNRNDAWDYDADGRLLDGDRVQYEYDAAGHAIETTSTRSNITFSFDGDGRRVKTVNSMTDTATPPNTNTVTTYYLPSTLLNQTITDLDGTGAKKQGYVFNGSGILAQEKPSSGSDAVLWRLSDESGYQVRLTNMDGDVEPDYSAELDPFGTNAGTTAPGPSQVPRVPGEELAGSLNSIGFGDPIASGMTECRMNGTEVPCQRALAAITNQSGQLTAGTTAFPGWIVDIPGFGSIVLGYDPTIPTWGNTGNPEFPVVQIGSPTVTVLGGGEHNHGPSAPDPGTAGDPPPDKPKCDAVLPTDPNQLAAVYKLSTEHTMFSHIGLRSWNDAGNARTGERISWLTLAVEALVFVGAIAYTATQVKDSWENVVLNKRFGGAGGTNTSDQTYLAGEAAAKKALNSDLDSDDCKYLKIAIGAAERVAGKEGEYWTKFGFTQWRGRSNGKPFYGGKEGTKYYAVGDSFFFYIFPGYRLVP